LPILCLADNDPSGPHISIKPVALATVIKQPYPLLETALGHWQERQR